MADEERGFGKAQNTRKHHRPKTPYDRGPDAHRQSSSPEGQDGATAAPPSSIFGAVFSAATTPFRAAASLMTKVSLSSTLPAAH